MQNEFVFGICDCGYQLSTIDVSCHSEAVPVNTLSQIARQFKVWYGIVDDLALGRVTCSLLMCLMDISCHRNNVAVRATESLSDRQLDRQM